jgi:hypothetical protein
MKTEMVVHLQFSPRFHLQSLSDFGFIKYLKPEPFNKALPEFPRPRN